MEIDSFENLNYFGDIVNTKRMNKWINEKNNEWKNELIKIN